MSLFHKTWWLDAVAGSAWEEVTVSEGGMVIGRLPFYSWRHFGARVIGMPPLTRTLGPLIQGVQGKPHGRRQHESKIIRELLEKLPRHWFFQQHLPPDLNNTLPFQFCGFSLSCEHVFEIDGRVGVDKLWSDLPTRTRTMIRRSSQLYQVRECQDVDEFYGLFERNIAAKGQKIHFQRPFIRSVFSACKAHGSGLVLGLYEGRNTMVAAIFVAWADERMHFLLQTRAPYAANGAVDTLIWGATRLACERGLTFDLDGLPNEVAARRMSQFGGELRRRTIVTRGTSFLPVMRHLRRELRWKLGGRNTFV